MSFRSFETNFNSSGNALIDLSPYIESVEWDIYQVSVQTIPIVGSCIVEIHHNGFFLCGTAQGAKDSASGPPDCVVGPKDMFTVMWTNGPVGGQALLGVWYNENATGTTYSTAH